MRTIAKVLCVAKAARPDNKLPPSSSGLGRRPLTAVTPVQIRSGVRVRPGSPRRSGPFSFPITGDAARVVTFHRRPCPDGVFPAERDVDCGFVVVPGGPTAAGRAPDPGVRGSGARYDVPGSRRADRVLRRWPELRGHLTLRAGVGTSPTGPQPTTTISCWSTRAARVRPRRWLQRPAVTRGLPSLAVRAGRSRAARARRERDPDVGAGQPLRPGRPAEDGQADVAGPVAPDVRRAPGGRSPLARDLHEGQPVCPQDRDSVPCQPRGPA
jgi:hypothetical protein